VSCGVAHLVEGDRTDVALLVARQVIAGVVLRSGSPAEDGSLFVGLDSLGAGEQSAGRNAGLDERAAIGTSAELGRCDGEALVIEVVDEESLDLGRTFRGPTRWRRRIGQIAVVDEADEVGRADRSIAAPRCGPTRTAGFPSIPPTCAS
jgi:hypothetical protein